MLPSKVVILSVFCLLAVAAEQPSFKECFQQDSISCVQMAVRKIYKLVKKKYKQ